MKHYKLHLGLLLLFFAALPAAALQTAASGPKAYGYLMWQEKYLLIGARVEDPMLSGTSGDLQVFPGNDDGLEISLLVPQPDGGQIAHRLAFSAAGGFAALVQAADGRWKTDNAWLQPPATMKFAVQLDGTINKSSDVDRGFTVEAAIPWEKLGGVPKPLAVLGFNFSVRARGESQSFTSWATAVTSEQENEDPSRWGRLLLIPGTATSEMEAGLLPCSHTFQMPLIDGKLGAEEWLGASVLTLQKPVPEFQPLPEAKRKSLETPLLMAIYRYDYLPTLPTQTPDFSQFPYYQPKSAPGPWYSAGRAGWHREQIEEVQRAGIDILLADYSPEKSARENWSRGNLTALVDTLKALRAERRPYPLLGLYLDPKGLAEALGTPADLTTERGRRLFYDAIKEFYQQVPEALRAEIGNPVKNQGFPVMLGAPENIANWNADLFSYVEQAFAADFSGSRLVWFADPAWKSKGGSGLLAYPTLGGDQATSFDASGEAPVAVLSPLQQQGRAEMSRIEPLDFRQQWNKLLALAPAYLIINSWNDFPRGNPVAPSRQEGFALVDTMQLLLAQAAQQANQPVRLRKADLPVALAPGGRTTMALELSNVSAEMIRSDEHIGLDVRLLGKDGRTTIVRNNDVVPVKLPPGGITRLLVPIEAKGGDGRSLSKGDYLVEIGLRRSSLAYLKSPLLSRDIAVFRIPLKVAEVPDYAFSLLDSSLRGNLKGGAQYTASVTLRNDGSRTWKPDDTRLFYQWNRVEDNWEAPAGGVEALQLKAPAGRLAKEVKPGEVVILEAVISTIAQKEPLPVSQPDKLEHYGLVWGLESGGKAAAGQGNATAIYIQKEDLGGYFVDSTTPGEMAAGKAYKVDIILTNRGPAPLLPENCALVAHWYYWDGSLARWPAASQPLAAALAPGESGKLTASVTAPAFPGPYYLVWDLKSGENYASGLPTSLDNESLHLPVMVQGNTCQALDLSQYGNVIAAASDHRRASGDFDGLGNSFPSEMLPPDLSGNTSGLYPSDYYVPQAPDSLRRDIVFRYPEKNGGLMKALSCRGQEIPLPETPVARLHILGAGTGAGLTGSLLLTFADGHSESMPLTLASWLEPEAPEATLAFKSAFLRGARGDNFNQAVYLHHYVLSPAQPGVITTLRLPDNPEMKIFAITVEGAPGP
jgi:hypothetical protein